MIGALVRKTHWELRQFVAILPSTFFDFAPMQKRVHMTHCFFTTTRSGEHDRKFSNAKRDARRSLPYIHGNSRG